MKCAFPYLLFALTTLPASAQPAVDSAYHQAFDRISAMLDSREPPSFKRAIFEVENAYFDGRLDYETFNNALHEYAAVAQAWLAVNRLTDYHAADSSTFVVNGAVFHLMTDTVFMAPNVPLSLPFTYDTADFFAVHDWTKMFVTKLLATHSGNCRSMPMLYKMLCEELGGRAYLAMAPNHMYLKQHSQKIGWYNTELTSAAFPTDAWIMASGYVSADAVRSGIYMDTLGAEHTLALCLVDLAQGYLVRADVAEERFIVQCCDKALAHFPTCVSAMLVKAEALGRMLPATAEPDASYLNNPELENTLTTLVDLGYREIPLEVYLQWMSELTQHREKYENPMLQSATPTLNSP